MLIKVRVNLRNKLSPTLFVNIEKSKEGEVDMNVGMFKMILQISKWCLNLLTFKHLKLFD